MKNVIVNGINYSGVSTVKLNTTSGGTATFKDIDEIVTSGGGSSNETIVSIVERTITSVGENELAGVDEIGAYAFANCKLLLSAFIPNTVKKTYSSVFSNCEKLANVTLSEGLTKIGDNMFAQCKALTAIEIPSTISTIEGSTFNFCTNLASVVFKGNITSIHASAFGNCTALTTLDFSNCTVVPTLADTSKVFLNVPKNCAIKIPSALAEQWQSDSNWSAWAFTNYVVV